MEDTPKVNSVDENSAEKTVKKLDRVQIASPSEVKPTSEPSPTTAPVLEKSSSPMVVDNVDDEEEYIEVDELPNVKSELLRNHAEIPPAAVLAGEENSVGHTTSATAKVDNKSPQEAVDNLSTNNNREYNSKYCKSCDISFKFLPTYVAHKKYYCSSQPNEENTSSLTGSESVPVVVPTNMATAAHIV